MKKTKTARKRTVRNRLLVAICCMGLLVPTISGCGGAKESEEKVVNVYTFVGYMQDPVVSAFEEETGIKINLTEFTNNEEMLAKLQSGGLGSYDVLMCGDYMIETMLELGGLLQPMDMSKIENSKNSPEEYMGLFFDPENEYSLPFMTGWYAIAINRDKYPDVEIDSVDDLWDPMFADDMMILDDQRADIALSLLDLGYSVNETDTDKIEEAAGRMEELKSNIKFFDSNDPKSKLVSGECGICYTWNSEILRAIREGANWEGIVPQEGVVLWSDNFCIPEKAPHLDNAYTFINWILEGENHAKFDEYLCYGVPNTAAMDLLPDDVKNSDMAYLPDWAMEKSDYIQDVGENLGLYDQIWTTFKQ